VVAQPKDKMLLFLILVDAVHYSFNLFNRHLFLRHQTRYRARSLASQRLQNKNAATCFPGHIAEKQFN